jgi:putative phage-type endonuclease
MENLHEISQGSEAWKELRLGKVSASRMADLLAKTKSGASASRAKYMAQLLCERMTGQPTEFFTTAAMQRGTEIEPVARAVYEAENLTSVEQVAWVEHPTIPMAGCSPDGFVGEHGLIEIKCKEIHNHLDSILNDKIDPDHQAQMMWQMACTGRQWCDYVCFDDRAPEGLQLFVKRLERNDELIQKMEDEVRTFLKDLESMIQKLNEIKEKNGKRL